MNDRGKFLCEKGDAYFNGAGIEQNYEEAFKYYTAAANLGYAMAIKNLGLCYVMGKGTGQDVNKAVSMFRMAADLNNKEAYHNLGKCYSEGIGV